MAVNITQNPQTITPSDNPVTWVFSSTQTAQPNFYFLVEVSIANPTTFSVIEKHKVYPEVSSFAHFNAQTITERFVEANNIVSGQALPKVRIKVTEYYNNSAQASATSNEVMFWKARISMRNFANYDHSEYYLNTASGVKFLTYEPRGTAKVKREDNFILSLLSSGLNTDFLVRTYESNGTLVDSVAINKGTDNLLVLSCGVYALETFNSVDFTNATYYTIEATNLAGNTEVFRIDLDDSCIYSTSSRLLWLNSLGGIDAFTFGLLTKEKTSVTSFGYEKQFGNFNSSNSYAYDLKEGTVVDYLKTYKKELELTSDWMLEAVQNWLSKSLYTSPFVRIQENSDLYRCKVTNASFDKKIQENDLLFQEMVKIELENDNSVNV